MKRPELCACGDTKICHSTVDAAIRAAEKATFRAHVYECPEGRVFHVYNRTKYNEKKRKRNMENRMWRRV